MLRFFSFLFLHHSPDDSLSLLDSFLTIPLERLTPKCDFHCSTPCMASFFFHLRTSFHFMCDYLHSLPFFYRTDHPSIYICLSPFAKNTAWSVHRVYTYIKRRYLLYFSPTWIYSIVPCHQNLSKSPRYFWVRAPLYKPCPWNSQQPLVAWSCCGSPQHPCPLKNTSQGSLVPHRFESTFVSTRAKRNN